MKLWPVSNPASGAVPLEAASKPLANMVLQLLVIVAAFDAAQAVGAERISFNEHIRPIFADRCFKCHGPDSTTREVGLRLDQEAIAKSELDDTGNVPIVAGKPEQSELFARLVSTDPDSQMPPPDSRLAVSEHEIALVRQWIEEGADWERHWSFIPPVKIALPTVRDQSWPLNEIDRFILARLEASGLQPTRHADREHLLRRVKFALSGLPPTLPELDAFLSDHTDDAYEKAVDRLLESPAFGERMALEWLDVARYGDTDGLFEDHPRSIYPWRDWVIDAFNNDLPYNDFITWQLAGDLLPNATLPQRIATGFLRNNPTSNEGGLIDEDYRVKYLVDRVNTTATAFLALTLECAQCHDHKYDPMTQREYYQFAGFFNNLEGNGNTKGATSPTIRLYSPEQRTRIAAIDEQLAEVDAMFASTPAELGTYLESWVKELSKQKSDIVAKVPLTMIAADMAKPCTNYILTRGEYDKRGEVVQTGAPASIMASGDDLPKNRIGLANWMTHRDNPLTSRVAVNRYWQMIFGVGIVRTSEDLGTQGDRPSHEKLLDYLAVDFIESGWDVKMLIRKMVLSATYRQASVVDQPVASVDPENRLLSHAPRFRLQAEFIRDHALSVSGLLVDKRGGVGVHPYQPAVLFGRNAIGAAGAKFTQGTGETLYRRSLYTYWKRQIPAANMRILGADGRTLCRTRRERTNTPLQALVLLNDPQFVEAARVFAERAIREGGPTLEQRLSFAFRLATSRHPRTVELDILRQEYADRLQEFQANIDAANEYLAGGGDRKRPKDLNPAELAAFAAVASLILNLDESISVS